MKRILQLTALLLTFLLLCFPLAGCDESDYAEGTTQQESVSTGQTTDNSDDSALNSSGSDSSEKDTSAPDSRSMPASMDKDGTYTSMEDVKNYLIEYRTLPPNFITKKEAQKLGWTGGSLEPYAPGKCIGGDRFGNYEGLLPEKDGEPYHECDIDTLGAKSRGKKRIVYADDGRIYYTDDHYKSFTLLYVEEE